jgi:hypothetical protein
LSSHYFQTYFGADVEYVHSRDRQTELKLFQWILSLLKCTVLHTNAY